VQIARVYFFFAAEDEIFFRGNYWRPAGQLGETKVICSDLTFDLFLSIIDLRKVVINGTVSLID